MKLKKDASEQKINGRYFTPKPIADYVTDWVLDQNKPIKSILEPSVGEGVFIESLTSYPEVLKTAKLLALEIDDEVSKAAAKKYKGLHWIKGWENLQVEKKAVINDDFYTAYKNGLNKAKYQAILGNPPYIRYQYLDEDQREEQSSILTTNGMKSNKLINAWVSFTTACVSCMDDDSRIGLVVPAELLQVKYSEDLRRFLTNHLNRVTIITFRDLVFEDIEQEVVLLLGEKIKNNDSHSIRIIQFDDAEQLIQGDLSSHDFFDADLTSTKWTKYFLDDDELSIVQSAEKDPRFVLFSKIAKCEVGITTGNNDYFCVDRSTVRKYKLVKYCKPLIARSVNIRGAQFSKEDWDYNISVGAKTYLLDLTPFQRSKFNQGVLDYIAYGEEHEQNTTYKCEIRDEWYKVPSVWSPDAFFLRRNYLYPKFMLNTDDVNAVSTDTMHRVRFNDKKNYKRAVVAYYTSIALLFSELEGRSYGGGVLEILPREVGRILLPDIFGKYEISDKKIDKLFDTIDNYMRENDDVIDLLDIIDKEILYGLMGIPMDEVLLYRKAWISLRNRRLMRGGREATELDL